MAFMKNLCLLLVFTATSLLAESITDTEIGVPCTWTDVSGFAVIDSISLNHDPNLNQCGIAPVVIRFYFHPDNPDLDTRPDTNYWILEAGDGKLPPVKWALENGLTPGAKFMVTKLIIQSG